jgi:hypothetical protein
MTKFLAAAILVAAAGGFARAVAPANKAHHTDHLATALKDIAEAESAAKAGSIAAAKKHTSAAIRQIEEVIHHHHTTAAIGGGLVAAHPHYHHHHLTRAVADLRAAEKQLRHKHPAAAEKDLAKASIQVNDAILGRKQK